MTIRLSLHEAKEKLLALDAEILLAHILHKPRSYLHAWPEHTLTDEQAKQFAEYVKRRSNREPVAYITGRQEFWSLELSVNSDTLIPRPETELLVETTLKLAGDSNPRMKVADLGTGSGAIALALAHERPTWQIYATDSSEHALQIARKNAQQLAINNISFQFGNWCSALCEEDMDIIVSNPPYIAETEWERYASGLEFEPRQALVSGMDGLEAIRTIIQSASRYLKPSGYLLIEHGYRQGNAVRELFAAAGCSGIYSINDLAGRERVTSGHGLSR